MNDAKLEKYVAHAALLDPRCANAVAMHDAELFTMPEYRRLRDAIVSLVEKNTDVTMVTLHIEDPEAAQVAAKMSTGMVSSTQWRSALDKLASLHESREYMNAIEQSKGVCKEAGAAMAKQYVEDTMKRIISRSRHPVSSMGEIEIADVLEAAPFIESGIDEFDERASGYVHGLTVIGGRPSVGKTAVALISMVRVAAKGTKVLFFSMEMRKSELAKRALAAAARVDLYALMTGRLNSAEKMRCEAAWPGVQAAVKNILVKEGITSLGDYLRTSRAMLESHNVGLICADHIGLFRVESKDQRYIQIREITRESKAFATDYNVPVVLLSQLRRPENEDREPSLHDLKESGAIEEDADTVLLLHASPTMRQNHQLKLILGKNRNGPTGHVDVTFIRSMMRIGAWAGHGYAENVVAGDQEY